MPKAKYKFKNNIAELQNLAVLLEEFCERNQVPMKVLFDLNLSLDELMTNIISYGYSDDSNHEIILEIDLDNKQLDITLIDDGIEFNPLNKEKPDLNLEVENKPIGGLGIFFVKQKMDEVNYERKDSKNYLQLKKSIIE